MSRRHDRPDLHRRNSNLGGIHVTRHPHARCVRRASARSGLGGRRGGRRAGAVYTLTNTAANAVIVYDRAASGELTWSGTFPTGGSGGSLGSPGAVTISEDGRWLYAVDAGSSDIAVFRITKSGLTWSDRVASGGIQPVSVTTSHDLVYVVNATSSNIAGFRSYDGKLSTIAGSAQSFIGTGAAQIQFAPSGSALVVTEKSTS